MSLFHPLNIYPNFWKFTRSRGNNIFRINGAIMASMQNVGWPADQVQYLAPNTEKSANPPDKGYETWHHLSFKKRWPTNISILHFPSFPKNTNLKKWTSKTWQQKIASGHSHLISSTLTMTHLFPEDLADLQGAWRWKTGDAGQGAGSATVHNKSLLFLVDMVFPKIGVILPPPKWMVYTGKPYYNGWFGSTPIFGNTHILGGNCCVAVFFLPFIIILMFPSCHMLVKVSILYSEWIIIHCHCLIYCSITVVTSYNHKLQVTIPQSQSQQPSRMLKTGGYLRAAALESCNTLAFGCLALYVLQPGTTWPNHGLHSWWEANGRSDPEFVSFKAGAYIMVKV